eukprot:gene14721-31295_t
MGGGNGGGSANPMADHTGSSSTGSSTGSGVDGHEADTALVLGLKPIRDRYLGQLLTRMTNPMFPEVEGFMAAVPSKRDLQLLLGVVQTELLIVVVESENSLLKAVCREVLKAVQLLLTKAEGMIRTGVDAKKITATQNFVRTSQQEHNGQLVMLLSQLHDALVKMPQLVIKSAQETQALMSGMNLMLTSTSVAGKCTSGKSSLDAAHT